MSDQELAERMDELRQYVQTPGSSKNPLPTGCFKVPVTHDPFEEEWDFRTIFEPGGS